MFGRTTRVLSGILIAAPLASSAGMELPAPAGGSRSVASAHQPLEIPAFARKYGLSCSVCHSPMPRLTEFGEQFAANGFELAPGEQPRDTIATGDPELRLLAELPLAVRMDAYARLVTRARSNEASTDLQTPWVMKLLSGGQIADRVSYYVYFLLSERGEVAGLEDAYVQFTDVRNSGVSVIVGQFQVSDPMFKRELRLPYEDYQAYRVRVGEARADLTYDRGVMASYSPREGLDIVFQVVNGQGLREGSETRSFDRDPFKNVSLRLSQDLGPARVGLFGYTGSERSDGVRSDIRIWGPDATIALGSVGELNLQYLRRTDGDPFFGACTPAVPCAGGLTGGRTTVDAALAEAVWWPRGSAGRVFVTGLLNWIDANGPVVSLGLGEQLESTPYLPRYTTGTLGMHYMMHRNLRVMAEAGWDFDRDQARLVTGMSAAF